MIDHTLDTHRIVDTKIKSTCEQFIQLISNHLVQPLKAFLEVMRRSTKSSAPSNIPPAEYVVDVSQSITNHLKLKIPLVRHSMSLYLANTDTENILFKPIKVMIIILID